MFSTRTNFNKCSPYRYAHIVHSTKTTFTHKTWRFPNISSIFQFPGVSFTVTNDTKILFCCVRYCKRFTVVKICAHSVDSIHSRFLRCPACPAAAQRFRLLLDSTGGGGMRDQARRRVSPSTTEIRKKSLPSPKSHKNKKGDFQFYKRSLRSLFD